MKRALVLLLALSAACDKKPDPTPTPAPSASASSAAVAKSYGTLPRAEFNALAPELALPVFWTEDKDKNGNLDPSELAVYWGLDSKVALSDFVKDGAFTPKFDEVYQKLVAQKKAAKDPDVRKQVVKQELSQGRVTLVATDLSKADEKEKVFVRSILKASEIIETLYAKQEGTSDLSAKIPAGDLLSKTLFYRGQGPECEAPATMKDPACSAIADLPKTKRTGLYPEDLLNANPKFCDEVGKKKDKLLIDPFTVVVKNDKGELAAKPYTEVWNTEMKAVANELEKAATALDADKEGALKAYLQAAAKSFTDNAWWPADEAWAKMDTQNSRYYLRIAPDEVYREPCSTKALFHVSFGLVNQGSVKWQKKLDPLKADMENALAALAGDPYKARTVTFKLPDFVDIALNAGDSRTAFGATIGQSLPNFGPVANEGRGRTVAMTSFYSDPDSVATAKSSAESLFCKSEMAKWTDSPEPQLMSTVLHEAAHNLGPAHQYKVNGKIDREVFGGPLGSTLEELKAQSAALFFTEWLIEKNQLTREEADKAHVRDMFWAFGHISRGMYEADGKHPKNYSQLAAIQLGWFMKEKAVLWRADEMAANGKDKGCFSILPGVLAGSIKTLMTEVAQIKGKGDKARAEVLIKDWVDVVGERKAIHDVITERITRAPKASFVYSIAL